MSKFKSRRLTLMIHAMTQRHIYLCCCENTEHNNQSLKVNFNCDQRKGCNSQTSVRNGGKESGHHRRWCCRCHPRKNLATSCQRHPYWSVSFLFVLVAVSWSVCNSFNSCSFPCLIECYMIISLFFKIWMVILIWHYSVLSIRIKFKRVILILTNNKLYHVSCCRVIICLVKTWFFCYWDVLATS